MSALLEGLVLVGVVLAVAALVALWYESREKHREQLLRESWAVYRASRAIHDETAAVLQKMMDEVRRSRPGGEA